jgi:hypothetical protein
MYLKRQQHALHTMCRRRCSNRPRATKLIYELTLVSKELDRHSPISVPCKDKEGITPVIVGIVTQQWLDVRGDFLAVPHVIF